MVGTKTYMFHKVLFFWGDEEPNGLGKERFYFGGGGKMIFLEGLMSSNDL